MAESTAPALPLIRRVTVTQGVLDVLLGMLLLAVWSLAGIGPDDGLGVWVPAGLYAAAAGARRLCPWAMVVLAVAGAAVQLVGATANAGSVLALALFFATAGFDRDRWIRWTGLGAAVVASIGGGVAAGTHGLFGVPDEMSARAGLLSGVQIAAVAGAAWLFGFVRHQRRLTAEARVAEQIARVEERRVADLLAHEQERTRIARDMHDVVAHTLAVVVSQAEGARYAMAQRPELVDQVLRTIAETCRDSLGDVRRLLGELRGEPSDASDPAPLDDTLFRRLRLAGLDLEVADLGDPRPLAEQQAATAQWVVTEALTNALRHGLEGETVTLRRTWGPELEVTVANAVAPGVRPNQHGHGLTGVAERVRLAGGWCDHRVESAAERARFVLRVRIPYESPAHAVRGA